MELSPSVTTGTKSSGSLHPWLPGAPCLDKRVCRVSIRETPLSTPTAVDEEKSRQRLSFALKRLVGANAAVVLINIAVMTCTRIPSSFCGCEYVSPCLRRHARPETHKMKPSALTGVLPTLLFEGAYGYSKWNPRLLRASFCRVVTRGSSWDVVTKQTGATNHNVDSWLVCGDGDLSYSAQISSLMNDEGVSLTATVLEDEETHNLGEGLLGGIITL